LTWLSWVVVLGGAAITTVLSLLMLAGWRDPVHDSDPVVAENLRMARNYLAFCVVMISVCCTLFLTIATVWVGRLTGG
jgi:hypothetical protein